jgi:hypothetical protein
MAMLFLKIYYLLSPRPFTCGAYEYVPIKIT